MNQEQITYRIVCVVVATALCIVVGLVADCSKYGYDTGKRPSAAFGIPEDPPKETK